MNEITKHINDTNASYRTPNAGDAKNTDLFLDNEHYELFRDAGEQITVRFNKENLQKAILFIASILPRKYDNSSVHKIIPFTSYFVFDQMALLDAFFILDGKAVETRTQTWNARKDVLKKNGEIDSRFYFNGLLEEVSYTNHQGEYKSAKFTIRNYLAGGYSDLHIKKANDGTFDVWVTNALEPYYDGEDDYLDSEAIINNNDNNSLPFNLSPLVSSLLSTGLIYSPTLIKRLAFSLMAKPFVILSGLAGSGKTQLALAFAKCLSENIEEQVCTVSIGADWTNREPLLGYPNALNKDEYVKPESGVLQLLMRANDDPSKPYFLILDEMNLSVVERYFADFLSAMESGEPIKLWDNESEAVPKEIALPKNVFIIGTINVDETTYMFSPKVLDRANVIEFKIAPDEMAQYLNETKDIHLENAYSACADMAADFVNKAKSQIQIDNADEKSVLLSFFKELKKVNAEFGYRTVNEISRYIHFVNENEDDKDKDDEKNRLKGDKAIDTAILQKLLPKLHGSRKKLVPVLASMWQLCLKDGVSKEIDAEFSAVDFKYPDSAEKIKRMYHAVVDNGFTSFAEA